METQRNTHHVYRLMYHFVWIPKYWHKVIIEPYRAMIKAIIQKVGYDYDIELIELEMLSKKFLSDGLNVSWTGEFAAIEKLNEWYFWGNVHWDHASDVTWKANAEETRI